MQDSELLESRTSHGLAIPPWLRRLPSPQTVVHLRTLTDVARTSTPSLFLARTLLAKYGISSVWSTESLRVAVVARLPKAQDRKQFNLLADKCATHEELIELAAKTLEAFKKRQTSLLPPPSGEMVRVQAQEEPAQEETEEGLQAPYTIR
jgi:hypothetical protein